MLKEKEREMLREREKCFERKREMLFCTGNVKYRERGERGQYIDRLKETDGERKRYRQAEKWGVS
jgi:hypothetical protein